MGGGLGTGIADSQILLVQIVPEHRNGLAANGAVSEVGGNVFSRIQPIL